MIGGVNIYRKLLIAVLFLLAFGFIRADTALAEKWEYKIEDTSGVNVNKTSAVVDTVNHEIRLPRSYPNMADMWEGSMDYIVLTPDGVKTMDAATQTLVDRFPSYKPANPITGISGTSTYPDVVIANGNNITHYSFSDEYIPNPFLSSAGFTDVLSVGSRSLDYAVLTSDNKITYRAYDGSNMVDVPALSVESGLTNPISISLFKDHYGMVVVDNNEIKYYKDGSLSATITGLTNAICVSTANGGNLAVVAGSEVRHYNLLSDGTFAYNEALSVTTG